MHDTKAILAIQPQPGLGGYIVNRIDKLPGSHLIVDKDVEASVRVVDEMTIINVGRINGERDIILITWQWHLKPHGSTHQWG